MTSKFQVKTKVRAGFLPAPLEDWYRDNYFNNEIDISGSGVENYTFKHVREIADFSFSELDSYEVMDAATVGSMEIRQKIADLFGTGNPNMIMITNGSNEALQLTKRSILSSGDEVITQSPCYHCHDNIATAVGCEVKKWEMSGNGSFEYADLAALVNQKTKALILNFPHNPTGVSISQSTLNKIVNLAESYGLLLVWDSAFQKLNYDTEELIDPIHGYPNTISVGTFSKAYGTPGLRFGWIVASESIIESCIRQKDYSNLFVAPLVEFVANKMLDKLEDFSQPRLEQAARNRETVNEWIESTSADLKWRQPNGGVCGLLKLPEGINDVVFCNKLLDQHGVLLVPGQCFRMPGHVRLGFGGDSNALAIGLSKVEQLLVTKEFS